MSNSRYVLLTGAGFTKNWGGYLASEFSDELLSAKSIISDERILQAFRADDGQILGFEDVLHSFELSEDREAISKLTLEIRGVFDRMMESCTVGKRDAHRTIHYPRCEELLRECVTNRKGDPLTSYIFTTNQDQFLEWFWVECRRGFPVQIPAVEQVPGTGAWFNSDVWTCGVARGRVGELDERSLKSRINYIKLHGSVNWESGTGSDQELIVGGGKAAGIGNNPLLNSYLKLFENVLHEPNRHLMTIGYGFADSHINEIIESACRTAGLKLWIWSRDPGVLFKISGSARGSVLGRTNRTFSEVFGRFNEQPGTELEKIRSEFFSAE